MCCPCVECRNEKDYTSSRVIQSHLLWSGFMSGYNVWTKHGERGVMMEDCDEEENYDDNYRSMFPEYADTAMKDNEEGGEERAPDEPADDLGWVISDAKRDCDTEKERLQFEQMLQDHNKLFVMSRGFLQIRFCLFCFLHHHDISIIASHVFGNKNYFY